MKFERILSETEDNVTWEFEDAVPPTQLPSLSALMASIRPSLLVSPPQKKLTGPGGITAAVPTAQLKLLADYDIPVTIMTKYGGFAVAPQQVAGSKVLIGKQRHMEDQDTGWDRVFADKEASAMFLWKNAKMFPKTVQNAVANILHGSINIWPFYIVPKPDKWALERRCVIILGDVANAIPPPVGQGINQALEDIKMFS
jgi:2-polyprenyl-6-methoxyphenol hydroxylase-like FAD-dependent oxidoreductase